MKSTYRSDIDGLRAVAVIGVVLFHAKLAPVHGGFVGVDVFFVISGFLITSILVQDIETGCFSITRFYERRVRRILPALVFMIATIVIVAIFLYGPTKLNELGRRLISVALFVANMDYYLLLDYFGPNANEQELLHTWSLAVEEQFYLFYPPLLFMLLTFGSIRYFRLALIAVGVLSFFLACYGVMHFRSATFYLLPTRAWELVVGCLLATRIFPLVGHRTASVLATIGFGAILVAMIFYSVETSFPGASALLPCLGTGAVIYAGQCSQQTSVLKFLSSAPLVGVGLISYSLYLWHWPLLVMPEYYLNRQLNTVEALFCVTAALALALFSWKFIEQPFRNRPGKRGHANSSSVARPLLVGSASLMIVVALGGSFVLTNGLPQRVSPSVLRAEAAASDTQEVVDCIDPKDPSLVDRCPASMKIFVWGDSHAAHFIPAMRAIFGVDAVGRFGGPGCPPVLGAMPVELPSAGDETVLPIDPLAGQKCRRLNEAAMNAIRARARPSLVLIGAAWPFFTEGTELSTGHRRYLTEDPDDQLSVSRSRSILATRLRMTLDVLTASGIHVLAMGDIAESKNAPSTCVAKAIMFGRSVDACRIAAKPAMKRLSYSNRLLKTVGTMQNVTTFLPGLRYCRDAFCEIVDHGNFVYRDEDHLTATASTALAPLIKDALALDGLHSAFSTTSNTKDAGLPMKR